MASYSVLNDTMLKFGNSVEMGGSFKAIFLVVMSEKLTFVSRIEYHFSILTTL